MTILASIKQRLRRRSKKASTMDSSNEGGVGGEGNGADTTQVQHDSRVANDNASEDETATAENQDDAGSVQGASEDETATAENQDDAGSVQGPSDEEKESLAIKIQAFMRMVLARKRAASMPMPIDEWKAMSREELFGVLATGKAVSLKVKGYFPMKGETATLLDGSKRFLLRRPFGTKAAEEAEAKKKARYAKKRKVGNLSQSVCQMKDSKVRMKATSVVKGMKTWQNMVTYSSQDLADACPPSDPFIVCRDCIDIRPDDKQQGLQERKNPHWSILLPPAYRSAEAKKDLGRYFLELGKMMTSKDRKVTAARKEQLTITSSEMAFLESLYGKPRQKKKDDDDDDDDEYLPPNMRRV